MEFKKRHIALPAALAVGLLLFLAVGAVFFSRYLEREIFHERTNQLEEVTAQIQVNLDTALDTQWRYLTTAANILKKQELESVQGAAAYIDELEQLLEADRHSSRLVLLDSEGSYYNTDGKCGLWPDLDVLAGGEEQYTYISDGYVYQDAYWTFVQKLNVPIRTREDGVSFTHRPRHG